jgi:acyl-CoA thioesterase YciA
MAEVPPDGEPMIRVTAMAADANPYGSAFVGWIMGQMALAAGSLASRHSGAHAPVVAADGLSFTAPVKIGDELSIYAELVKTGRTSMTIETQAWVRDRHGEDRTRAASGTFTLVALENGKPRAVERTQQQLV